MKHGLLSVQPESYSHWAIIGLFVMTAVAALSFAQAFFIPVIFALLLALTFSPIRRAMGRIGIGPGVSAAIIMIVFCTISAVLLFLISSSLAAIVSDEPQLMNKVQERVKEMSGMLEPVRQAGEQLEDMQTPDEGVGAPEQVVIRQQGIFSLWAQTTPYVAGQIGLAIVLASFLIASGDMFYEKLVEVMPNLTAKQKSLKIAREMERQLSTYFLTITAINATLGICVGTAMWLIGMPNPVFFGVVAFALNYIPYVGSLIGILITFIMAVGTYDNLLMSAVPPFAYWLINTAEGQFITPVAVGRRLKLNAVAVFLSLAFLAWLWSFAGMFLSTPMLIALKAFSARKPELAWLDTFLAGRKASGDSDDDMINDVIGAGNDAGQAGDPKSAEEVNEHLPDKTAADT